MEKAKKVAITQEACDRLKEELLYLEGEGRQSIIDEISVARAHGDLSENAEYHAAKDQQGLQEARARQIREMLENAQIIQADHDGIIKPGKVVTIRSTGEAETETYFLGLREEKGSEYDVLTPESPIGRSLLGHSAGDKVVAKVPAGELELEVLEVRTS